MFIKSVKEKFFIASLFLGVFFSLGALQAKAASEAEAALNCKFEIEIEKLNQLKTESKLDYLDKVKAELAIRKDLLRKIIDCSAQEAEVMKSKLESVEVIDKELSIFKEKTLVEIDKATAYYKSEIKGISDLGIEGSKNLARKILDWRSGSYSNLVGITVNLITWNNVNDFVGVADQRLAEVRKVTFGVEEDDQEITVQLEEAEKGLEDAKKLLQESKEAILDLNPNGETIEIIKESLEALSHVYNNFFEISKVLNTEEVDLEE